MRKTTIAKVNGTGRVGNSIPRKVLERNTMDIITDRGYSFDECLDFVECSSEQALMNFLREYDLADDYEAVIREYMDRFLEA